MSALHRHLQLLRALFQNRQAVFSGDAERDEFLSIAYEEKIENFCRWKLGMECDMNWAALSLRHQVLLEKFCGKLEKSQIRFAVIKGADLSFRVYPSPTLRSFGDWDMLIHPEDWEKIHGLLQEEQWELRHWEQTRREHHAVAISPRKIILEPHWSLPGFSSVGPRVLWQEIHPVAPGRCRHLPSPELYLLLLTRHLGEANYLQSSLGRYLLDIAFLLQKTPVNWNRLLTLCNDWRLPYPGNLLAALPEFFEEEIQTGISSDPGQSALYRNILEQRRQVKLHYSQAELTANAAPQFRRWLQGLSPAQLRRKYDLPAGTSRLQLCWYQVRDLFRKTWLLAKGKLHKNRELQNYMAWIARTENAGRR